MRHKGRHAESGGGVQLGLIITPMLDMSFQLMAFFIMTYHPSALEGHIDGNLLPPTLLAQKSKSPVPTPMDPNTPAARLLVIRPAYGTGSIIPDASWVQVGLMISFVDSLRSRRRSRRYSCARSRASLSDGVAPNAVSKPSSPSSTQIVV